MNSKIKFYQTIHFKIALVFALMLMLTLEVVGAVFVRQLEQENLNTFKQQIELPTYVDSSLAKQLSRTNEKAANRQIKQILSEVKNNNISEIRVVDAKGIVRGTSNASNQDERPMKPSRIRCSTIVPILKTYTTTPVAIATMSTSFL